MWRIGWKRNCNGVGDHRLEANPIDGCAFRFETVDRILVNTGHDRELAGCEKIERVGVAGIDTRVLRGQLFHKRRPLSLSSIENHSIFVLSMPRLFFHRGLSKSS